MPARQDVHDGIAGAGRTAADAGALPRGNWQNESGELLQPATPHFLPQLPNPDNHRLTRLDLAEWIVSPENPLTARAAMNRLWKQYFGTGISAVVDDLGGQGEWPVHPELLDWLACEFEQPALDDHGKALKASACEIQTAKARHSARLGHETHGQIDGDVRNLPAGFE